MTFAQEQLTEPDSSPRPSRHATIMRGIVAPILGLLAITAIILGALNATIWKPSAHVNAFANVSGSRYIVTDPGVLQLIDDRAQLQVTTSEASQVCVALGTAKDVSGWIAGHSYTRLTGLSDWTTISTESMQAQGTKISGDDAVSTEKSDMWSSVKCGASSASIRAQSGENTDVALIDLGANPGKATVTMVATRQKTPDFAAPLYFIGALLVVLTVLAASVFAMPSHKRRKRLVTSKPTEVGEEVAIAQAFTGSIRGLTSAMKIKPQAGSRHKRHVNRPAKKTGNAFDVTQEAAGQGAQTSPTGPVIVDSAERNLVADMQDGDASNASSSPSSSSSSVTLPTIDAQSTASARQASADTDEPTTVISSEELQAYFARLSKEMTDQSDTSADANKSTEQNESTEESRSTQRADTATDRTGAGEEGDQR